MRRPLFACAFALLTAALACSKPGKGDHCEHGEAACLDSKNELQCDNGAFVEAPCKGPRGCAVVNELQSCDISGNAQGDPCSSEDEGVSQCVTDKKARVVCRGRRYAIEGCRGAKGCVEHDGIVDCDQSAAAPSAACDKQGAQRCAEDKKTLLVCSGNAFVPGMICRGPAGCSPSADPQCDRGLQSEGDPCVNEGDAECGGEDKRALLSCQGKKWVVKEACKTACVSTKEAVACRPIPLDGDPCTTPGARECSGDKQQILVCAPSKAWKKEKECPKPCAAAANGKPRCGA